MAFLKDLALKVQSMYHAKDTDSVFNQLIFDAKTRLFGPIQARCKSGKNRSKNMDKLNILLGL